MVRAVEHLGHRARQPRRRRRPRHVFAVAIGLAEGDRRPAHQMGGDGRANGPAIAGLGGDIGAGIDARQDQVGRAVCHHVAKPHDHAIGRRAGHREPARRQFLQPHRLLDGQLTADPGIVAVRRHHPNLLGQVGGDRLGDGQTSRPDAIVIGHQNTAETLGAVGSGHGAIPLL